MTDYNLPTQRAHDDRMKFDALRHQIAQFDYTGHHVPVGPTPSRLPCTNQPLFSLFDDESIIARSPQYTLRHHGPTAESLINCHDREDITELKPLSDVGHQRGEGPQGFHKIQETFSRTLLYAPIAFEPTFTAAPETELNMLATLSPMLNGWCMNMCAIKNLRLNPINKRCIHTSSHRQSGP